MMSRKEAEQVDDELAYLRRQNSELKGLVLRALEKSLKLEDLPSDLRDDRDSVLMAVRAKAVDWCDLPQKWKDDAEIVCAAFETQRMHKEESHFVDETVGKQRDVMWSKLPYHIKMNEKVILHAFRSGYGPYWEDIPFHFKANVDLLATAVLCKRIRFFDNVPSDLQRNHPKIAFYFVKRNLIQADECPCLDRGVFKQALADGELDWGQLPIALRNDISFAQESVSRLFTGRKLPRQILRHNAEICHDPTFWRRLLHASSLGKDFNTFSFKILMEEFAPAELRSDRDFMLEMCRECTHAFPLVDRSLASDQEFLELVLEQNAAVLQFLSHETQQRHPDLVIKAILALGQARSADGDLNPVYYAALAIWPSFWIQCDFAMTWVKAGYGFPKHALDDEIFVALTSDRALCLASAIHSKSLNYVSEQFTSDVPFMLEVMDHHPALYSAATGAAKVDRVVVTTAFASLPDFVSEEMLKLHFRGQDNVIKRCLGFLRRELNSFKAFEECILGNMLSTQSVADTGTNLTLLNQGLETSTVYKRLLAEYLDIPTGKWLRRLQQAERNVCEAIAPWAPNA